MVKFIFSAIVVRIMTGRFIWEYDPTLEAVYRYNTTIDDDQAIIEILDTAGMVKSICNILIKIYIFIYVHLNHPKLSHRKDLLQFTYNLLLSVYQVLDNYTICLFALEIKRI